MKDMIKRIREERDGFTLAELLIVVAIIAVLVAIAIPIFNAQLENSREATDAANLRSAYAEVSAAAISNDKTEQNDVKYDAGTGQKTAKWSKGVVLTQTQDGWQNDSIKENGKIGTVAIDDAFAKAGKTAVVTYDQDSNETTITIK